MSTTEFEGSFKVTPALKQEHAAYLGAFNSTRRMKRDAVTCSKIADPVREAVDLPVGTEGAFFVGGVGPYGQGRDPSVVDYNVPPRGQPGLWCKWVPVDDDNAIGWDWSEKFYDYTEWIAYLIEHFLGPWGYVLSGTVRYQGEDAEDFGKIHVVDNIVSVARGERSYCKPEVVGSEGG